VITELKPHQVFVFGSNLAGAHAGGAARQAYDQFGAVWGDGEGLRGQSYAFPTLDKDMQKRKYSDLLRSRTRLYQTCEGMARHEFLLTKVGCGIAGYPEEFMKKLFAHPPKNLILPEDWRS
jgi:hypothetical protein